MKLALGRAALLVLVSSGCIDAAPPGGTLDGIRTERERKHALSRRLCEVQAMCRGNGARWDDDGGICPSKVAAWFEVFIDADESDACVDARLDYMACLAERPCLQLRGEVDQITVFLAEHPQCRELVEAREALCPADE